MIDNNSTGFILSPHYPNDYPVDSDCMWLIEVSDGSTIDLTFMTFDLQAG